MDHYAVPFITALAIIAAPLAQAVNDLNYDHCTADTGFRGDVPIQDLPHNSLQKICPGRKVDEAEPLGQPMCGDGGAYSFYFTKPKVSLANEEKLLIEVQGGGACWDSATCAERSNLLSMPTLFDFFLGFSCTDIQTALDSPFGFELGITALCAQRIGNVNLSTYNTIFIPYCTQDIHIGDKIIDYNSSDNNGTQVVAHHGGHNIMATLDWVIQNFPNLKYIDITGCSAGGTAMPFVYDLLNKHYNNNEERVSINVIMDSAVFLTPEPFLRNYFGNWNPETMITMTGIDFEQIQYDPDYATKLTEHILQTGGDDQWGFVTHEKDPVSLKFWEAMGGVGNFDDWWSEMSVSFEVWKESSDNFNTFLIPDAEEHCSFGFHYVLETPGFKSWASEKWEEVEVDDDIALGDDQSSSLSNFLVISNIVVVTLVSVLCLVAM